VILKWTAKGEGIKIVGGLIIRMNEECRKIVYNIFVHGQNLPYLVCLMVESVF
jgi:hypothetical protein